MQTNDAARGRWEGILRSFGVDEQYLQNRHGPCWRCGGKDKWRWDNKDGAGTYFCNSHGSGDGFDFLMDFTGREFGDIAKEIDEMLGTTAKDAPRAPKTDPKIRLMLISKGLRPVSPGDPVARYLHGRGLVGADLVAYAYLRYHSSLNYYDERGVLQAAYPGMVAAMKNAAGAVESFHITYLSPDGTRQTIPGAKKMMPPRTRLAGTLIRLSEPCEHLGIAEGIETALAATALTGLPCWASGTAGLMESAEFPSEVKKVTIFGDNDASFAGHKAAYALAHKLAIKGIAVDVRFPAAVGHDFADEVAAK